MDGLIKAIMLLCTTATPQPVTSGVRYGHLDTSHLRKAQNAEVNIHSYIMYIVIPPTM